MADDAEISPFDLEDRGDSRFVDGYETRIELQNKIKDLFSELRNFEDRIKSITKFSETLDGYLYPRGDQYAFHAWVKKAYSERQTRKIFFTNPNILGEPCWDILLDLTVAAIEGKRISVTSACIASGVPPTTALRWISLLEKEGLAERSGDLSDKRRFFIKISDKGMKAMYAYFQKIKPSE